MRLDKTGDGHPALGIEYEASARGRVTFANAHKPASGYSDIAQALAAPNGDVLDENIRDHCNAPCWYTTNVAERLVMGAAGASTARLSISPDNWSMETS
jgi:hypothetical protein